jgi:hypothetical protein
MSSPTELLPGTGIAATSWKGASYHLRVYTQDIQGGIRESRWDGNWSGGTANDVIARAKPHSPIAVFNYNAGKSIRVYYLSVDNVIQEMCQDDGKKWFAGGLNASNFKASPVSRLAVIGKTWADHHITLYYQRPDEAIGELMQDNSGWVQGGKLGEKPILGSGLAAVAFHTKSSNGIRVYYQLPDGTLAEAGINEGGKWFRGGLPKIDTAAPASNMTAFAYGVDNPSLQVFFLGKTNTPTEFVYSGGWHGPYHPGNTTASPGAGISVIPVTDPGDLRLYIQDENNRIMEYISSGGNWNRGSFVPVGGLQ